MTREQLEKTFWSDGNVLYLNGGYVDEYDCQTHLVVQ